MNEPEKQCQRWLIDYLTNTNLQTSLIIDRDI